MLTCYGCFISLRFFWILFQSRLKNAHVPTPSEISTDDRCPTPDTPLESYFLLNPSDMDNYLHYKVTNNEKLVDWDPVCSPTDKIAEKAM